MEYTPEEIDNYNFEYELDENGNRQLNDHVRKFPESFTGIPDNYKRKWKEYAKSIGGIDSTHRKCDRCGKLCGERYPYSNKVIVKAQWSSKYFHKDLIKTDGRIQYKKYEADLCDVCLETLQIGTWLRQ